MRLPRRGSARKPGWCDRLGPGNIDGRTSPVKKSSVRRRSRAARMADYATRDVEPGRPAEARPTCTLLCHGIGRSFSAEATGPKWRRTRRPAADSDEEIRPAPSELKVGIGLKSKNICVRGLDLEAVMAARISGRVKGPAGCVGGRVGPQFRDRAVGVLAFTGCRVGEICRLGSVIIRRAAGTASRKFAAKVARNAAWGCIRKTGRLLSGRTI